MSQPGQSTEHRVILALRNAIYHWSRVSTQGDPHSAEHYAALRAKGHSHGRALRGVGDRWLAMLMAMLKSGTEYDPALRQKKTAVSESSV